MEQEESPVGRSDQPTRKKRNLGVTDDFDEKTFKDIHSVVNDDILNVETIDTLMEKSIDSIRDLAKVRRFKNTRGIFKSLSTNGTKSALVRRILAWEEARKLGKEQSGSVTLLNASAVFHSCESARLIEILVSPSSIVEVSRIFERASRSVLDASALSPMDDSFTSLAKIYNDGDVLFAKRSDDPVLDPNNFSFIATRNGKSLKGHLANMRSQYTLAFEKWSRSGQQDPDTFSNYCGHDPVMLYLFDALSGSPFLATQFLRLLPPGSAIEAGTAGHSVERELELRDQQLSEFSRRRLTRTRKISSGSPTESPEEHTSSSDIVILGDCIRDAIGTLSEAIVSSRAQVEEGSVNVGRVRELCLLESEIEAQLEVNRSPSSRNRKLARLRVVRALVNKELRMETQENFLDKS
jgi:hypothetical protein